MRRILALFLLLFVAFPEGISYADTIPVVVSIYPLKDIVKQVGGDRVEVDFMVPPGATPHTFEPTPTDMVKMNRARVFFMIGAGLEFWADKAIRAAGGKNLRVIALSSGMPFLHGAHEQHGHIDDRDKAVADPHVWLDPRLVQEMVDTIAGALGEIDAAHKAAYRARAEAYKRELGRLDAEIAGRVGRFRIKEYVTFHAAWGYFSRRYGLRVLGVIEESPGKEAGPKHIAKIVEGLKHAGAKVVFAEPQFNPKIAEVIAREAGAQVVFLDPLGSPVIRGRETYMNLMRYNVSVLEQAMR